MSTKTTTHAAGDLLALWECAAAATPAGRGDALLGVCGAGSPLSSLGARNAALLNLRARLFGAAQALRCDCPRCAVAVEFGVNCEVLSRALLPRDDATQAQLLQTHGHRIEFRVPDVADLREACRVNEDFSDEEQATFADILLQRCVIRCERDDGSPCSPQALPAPVAEALSCRMEELEPGASVSFDVVCPECGEAWTAPMNVADVVWRELQARAERLLLDVDALARAYGWSEPQVLALSPTRRAAYLQLAGAA
jgi:hypothetical protein